MRNLAITRFRKKTFAPSSRHFDVNALVKPSKGSIVEVVVAWHERVIGVRHFSKSAVVTVGSDPSSDMIVPGLRARRTPILKIDGGTQLIVPAETAVEISSDEGSARSRYQPRSASAHLPLAQGELARLELGNQITLLVRHVPDTPSAIPGSPLELTTAETTGTVLALALFSVLRLYTAIYQAPRPSITSPPEPQRQAKIVFSKPLPPPLPVAVETPAVSVAAPSPVRPAPVIVKRVAAKNPRAVSRGIKNSAATSQPSQRNLFLSALASDGSGVLTGLAKNAAGRAGSPSSQSGPELKETGGRGGGPSLTGAAGEIVTKGRAGGNGRYGVAGLGHRTGVQLSFGGGGEAIKGSIDREAIRRVIVDNLKTIRGCYERELNRTPGLYGKLVLSWEIGEQGRVVSARTKSNELDSRAVADCIIAHLKEWRFPEPPARQVVEVEAFPFLFSN